MAVHKFLLEIVNKEHKEELDVATDETKMMR
jgi:hypothetical protein